MSNGTFNGALSPWTRNHADNDLQAQHAERRKQAERQERAESWLVSHLAGQTFESLPALTFAATRTVEIITGRPLDAESRRVIENAARAIFCGLAQRPRTRLELAEDGRVAAVTFAVAA